MFLFVRDFWSRSKKSLINGFGSKTNFHIKYQKNMMTAITNKGGISAFDHSVIYFSIIGRSEITIFWNTSIANLECMLAEISIKAVEV